MEANGFAGELRSNLHCSGFVKAKTSEFNLKKELNQHIGLPEASAILLNFLSFITVGPQFRFPGF